MGALNIMELNKSSLIHRLKHILQMKGQIGHDLKTGDVHYESMYEIFVKEGGREYRFIGTLGFGGKIYYSISKGFWVDCYPEDLTDERAETIKEINRSLDILVNKSDKFGFLQH